MIFYYVILLFLSWPQARCTADVSGTGEEIFDQLATASENMAQALRHSNATSKSLGEQHPSAPSSGGVTVHYENSNGFVPMIPMDSASYDEPGSASLENEDNLDQQDEEQFDEGNATNVESPNEFELLKVNNDTPAVANYQDFYENLRSAVNTESDSEPDAASPGRANGERGKKTESYVHSYNTRPSQQTQKNIDPYVRYYSYNDAQDTKKLTYEQEKVPGNYRQQNTANYDGHGQSAVRQNIATVSSSSRTNYEANELTHGGAQAGTYDVAAEPSRSRYKFSKPVVVAEPSNYKVEMKPIGQFQSSEEGPDYKTSRNLESSSSAETYDGNRQRSYHRTEDSRNTSDETSDYSEFVERPRRVQKNRRRPGHSDFTRKLPKEHRGTLAGNAEEQDKRTYDASRLKPQRYRVKANPWINDASINHHEESVEDVRHDTRVGGTGSKSTKTQHVSKLKNTNAWNQLSPNLEISHSNGIELDHVEKPKYVVPVKFNFVPVANFDHATALGTSQGFDVSNALLHNMVTASPIGSYTTSSPILSTSSSIIGPNLALPKNLANAANLGISTSIPDIIVGQTMPTVVLSQPNGQNKVADAVRAAYLPSTVAPMIALTSSLTPTLQNVRLQNVQGNVTPRTAFAVTPTPTTVVQHVPINQAGMQQLLIPQPTVQAFSGFLQTPVQGNGQYQIQVNPHGLQGQNLMNQGNLQVQSLPTTSTVLSSQAEPEGRINLSPAESKKNTYATTADGNLLATASLAVSQNGHKQATNANPYYLHNHNTQKPDDELLLKDIDIPKTKAYLQATQVVPTVLQSNPTLTGLAVNNAQQYVKLQGNGADEAVQLQLQMNRQLLKNNKLHGVTLQTADNWVGHSSGVNAHLPNVGTKNVEIVNPNMKPNDATVNAYSTINYPATVLTTPIPIFSTIAPVTPQTISLQNYVDSLTETGAKIRQLGVDLKASQNQEQPMYNPINFVPNIDILKNQNALNKLPSNEPIQQGLNLVPVMPGGNFFKPSYAAQSELMLKPKLASDLQKYAEEMFKESLKTMYNSQKWNNDRKPFGNNQSNYEANDLTKLRLELQRLKSSMSESQFKDLLEAHQSENQIRTTDIPKYLSDKKKPDSLLATLEHLLKNRPHGQANIYHSTGRPGRKPKPSADPSFGFHDEIHSDSHLRGFLPPPRTNRHRTKGAFHDNKPMKNKRPSAGRYKNGPRKPGRGRSPGKPNGIEGSAASNVDTIHLVDESLFRRPHFDSDTVNFESKHIPSYNAYPTFTTSSPDLLHNILREIRTSNNKEYDINHPRIHNLLGLLMKNKQLPSRGPQSYRNKDHIRQFFDAEKRQLQQQFYDDALKDYILDKFEGSSGSIAGRKVYSGNGTA